MSAPDLLNVTRPPAWVADALCAEVDPELWYPDKGGSTWPARRICQRCPVRPDLSTNGVGLCRGTATPAPRPPAGPSGPARDDRCRVGLPARRPTVRAVGGLGPR
ncbi:MAG: WhiB family transcriptional regulator [Actinomycetota bacterium]|nr:WhiB family transcriptional regulator [Actinomycetota bacterium]